MDEKPLTQEEINDIQSHFDYIPPSVLREIFKDRLPKQASIQATAEQGERPTDMDEEQPNGRRQDTIPWEVLFGYFVVVLAMTIVAASLVRFGNGTSFIAILLILVVFLLRKEFI